MQIYPPSPSATCIRGRVGLFVIQPCVLFESPLSAHWSEQYDTIRPHGKFSVTLSANRMYFESHVTVRWRVKVATSRMVIKVDRLLRHAYNAVCVCVCAFVGGAYLCMLAWCHSRCHCWCRSLWQHCPLRSSRTPADTWTSHSAPLWSPHQI